MSRKWMADREVQLTLADASGDRLDRLIAEARATVEAGIAAADGREITGIVVGFSGGNDSTVLAHLFRDVVTHYAHANTQVGAEPTRQFVRDTAARWGVPLLEEPPPRHSYEDLVLGHAKSVASWAKYPVIYQGGFPGPSDHRLMFGHLKGKTLNRMATKLSPSPRRQRSLWLNGKRKSESQARTKAAANGKFVPVVQGDDARSTIRLSPLINWTKLDLNEYRRRHPDVPRNETADLLHMSAECACGCYAHEGELGEYEMWLPGLAEWLHKLRHRLIKENLDINPKRLCWGFANQGKCTSGMCNT